MGQTAPMSATAAAELTVTAEHVSRYRERIAALVPQLQDGEHDDAVAAIYEAERALRSAHRSLDRASKLLGH